MNRKVVFGALTAMLVVVAVGLFLNREDKAVVVPQKPWAQVQEKNGKMHYSCAPAMPNGLRLSSVVAARQDGDLPPGDTRNYVLQVIQKGEGAAYILHVKPPANTSVLGEIIERGEADTVPVTVGFWWAYQSKLDYYAPRGVIVSKATVCVAARPAPTSASPSG